MYCVILPYQKLVCQNPSENNPGLKQALKARGFCFLTLSQTTDFRLCQIQRVCRQQFKFDQNGRKLSKWVKNTVGKGEIARYEQFLLFPQCFLKTCSADT